MNAPKKQSSVNLRTFETISHGSRKGVRKKPNAANQEYCPGSRLPAEDRIDIGTGIKKRKPRNKAPALSWGDVGKKLKPIGPKPHMVKSGMRKKGGGQIIFLFKRRGDSTKKKAIEGGEERRAFPRNLRNNSAKKRKKGHVSNSAQKKKAHQSLGPSPKNQN